MGRIEPQDIVIGQHTPVEWDWLPDVVVQRLRLEHEKKNLEITKNPRFAEQWFRMKTKQLAKQNVHHAALQILQKQE